MGKIRIQDARAGQILNRSVVNASGVTLVQQGSELTGSLIQRLTSMGVAMVSVEAPNLNEKSVEERITELDARFLGHEGDSLMMEIKAVLVGQIRESGPEPHEHE